MPQLKLVVSDLANDYAPLTTAELKNIAGGVPNNAVLRKFIRQVPPQNQKALYDALKPHFRFRAWPMWMLT